MIDPDVVSPALLWRFAWRLTAPPQPVTCEIDGTTFKGTCWIAGKIRTVATGMGGKSRQVGTTPAEDLAKQLLQQLVKEEKA